MKSPILTGIFLLLILISCNKEKEAKVDSIYHSWEAKSFISLESTGYPKNKDKKIGLVFSKEENYGLSLDINGCGGSFKVLGTNGLEISPAICTLICCDSQFSEKLAIMLPKVTSYSIDGKTLNLNVPQWGYIELELAE